MIVKHYQYSADSILDRKPFEEGAIYFIEDTQHVYLDPVGGTERIKIASDIVILATELDRTGLLSPIPGKLYFILENSRYYIYYNDMWYAGGGSNTTMAGLIYINPSSTLPEGFLWCDGSAYSSEEYPELYAAIGTRYGNGTNGLNLLAGPPVDDDFEPAIPLFNVPDLTTRVPVGSGNGYTIGQTGGANADNGEESINFVSMTDLGAEPNDLGYMYTVVNYIISTGKDTPTLSVADVIASMQVLPLSIKYGGTGANNAEGALTNLGGASITYVNQRLANIKTPTLQEHLAEERMILSSLQYGTELPSSGIEGQVFFKIATE